ncbi:MAG: TIGR03960 family B12-binding radical SAM protein [Atopobiaceae bacterium]|nr:TIGR03960 family B12-binding radical SAM protein [Atopobiaceae bacterium]
MADRMRQNNSPLLALESAAPVASFDVVGISIGHEMACTNILETLDLAGLAFRASERDEDDPILIAGGPSVYNPEPYCEIFDAILIGDGEELIVEVCEAIKAARAAGLSRTEIVESLCHIESVYVPSLYEIHTDESSTRWGYALPREGSAAPELVLKRTIQNFADTDPVPQTVIPFGDVVFNRLSIEVLRGCARGCRFCQAGITYRPVRERTADQVVAATIRGLEATGYDEVSLTSLSTTDHSCCAEMLRRLNNRLDGTGVQVSIPSQRLDSFGVDMAAEASGGKRSSLTFAPEAGTQRLRDVINKNISSEDLTIAATNAFSAGWQRMKLYFMMGLPTERDEDIVAIPESAAEVMRIGRSIVPKGQRGGLGVSVSVSVFVPKPWTPFQWEGQLPLEKVRERQKLLLESTHDRAIRIAYHDAETSQIEAVLSRIGRAGLDLIIAAWHEGCRFDAWSEQFHYDAWLRAAESVGMDLSEIASTAYRVEDRLPWDHVSPGVSKRFLALELERARKAQTTPDCTFTDCVGCGLCPAVGADNSLAGVRHG